MKIYQIIIIAVITLLLINCSGAANTTPQIAAGPTDVLRNFIEASKKKDVEAIKKTLSKGSLEMAEKSAKTQNTTVDEMFKRENLAMPEEVPEIRNERVEGDTATVEVKNLTDGYDTIPFVREDGVWKISFDKYQQMVMEKMRQEMQNSATNLSKPDGDGQPNGNSNKAPSNK
jgi:hypothetical protein